MVEQWVAQPQRYSARQLSQKLKDERQVEIGAEQVRRRLKKGATPGVFEDEYDLAIAIKQGIQARAQQGNYGVERFIFN